MSDFPAILAATANKILRVVYEQAYREGNFGDAKEVFRIYKYGRMFGLSREAFINDDLGVSLPSSPKPLRWHLHARSMKRFTRSSPPMPRIRSLSH